MESLKGPRTVLITGGRAPVALDLARTFAKAGHRVLLAESDPYALSASSAAVARFFRVPAPNERPGEFAKRIGEILAQESVDVLIPTCEEVFHLAAGLDQLRAMAKPGARLWLARLPVLERLHSKFEFNRWIDELGMPGPLSFRCESELEVMEALSKFPSGGTNDRVVLKPEFSRFAASALILNRSEVAETLKKLGVNRARPWVLQQYLRGAEYCTYSLFDHGRLLAHCTYDHEFTAGRGAGICFRAIHHSAIERWVTEFGQKIGFSGQMAFDFIETADGTVLPIECNPRATSGLHLLSSKEDYVEAILHSSLSGNPGESKGGRPTPVLTTSGDLAQIRLAMLVYGLPSVRSMKSLLRWLSIFARARETIFSWQDPVPFFSQFVAFYRLFRLASRRGVTPLEASTLDIEWNGNRALGS